MPKYVSRFDDQIIREVYRSGRVNLLLCVLLALMAVVWMNTSLQALNPDLPDDLNSTMDSVISGGFVVAYVALSFGGLFVCRALAKGPWGETSDRPITFIYLVYILIAFNLFFGLSDQVAFSRQANHSDELSLTAAETAAVETMSSVATWSFTAVFGLLAVAIWALVAHHKARNSMLIAERIEERQRRVEESNSEYPKPHADGSSR